jgi:hypothetical protein
LRGRLAKAARRTIVGSYHLDIHSQKDLEYQIAHLLDEDSYMMNIIGDKKAWFTRFDILDLIYHIFFFTVNTSGQVPHTAKYFDLVSPWTLAIAAAAIHCALSDYEHGTKVITNITQDDYQSNYYLFHIHFICTDPIWARLVCRFELLPI